MTFQSFPSLTHLWESQTFHPGNYHFSRIQIIRKGCSIQCPEKWNIWGLCYLATCDWTFAVFPACTSRETWTRAHGAILLPVAFFGLRCLSEDRHTSALQHLDSLEDAWRDLRPKLRASRNRGRSDWLAGRMVLHLQQAEQLSQPCNLHVEFVDCRKSLQFFDFLLKPFILLLLTTFFVQTGYFQGRPRPGRHEHLAVGPARDPRRSTHTEGWTQLECLLRMINPHIIRQVDIATLAVASACLDGRLQNGSAWLIIIRRLISRQCDFQSI